MSKSEEGWAWPVNSRKAHYFVDGRSLCGKWMYLGEVEEGNDYSPDNCRECIRRLEKKREGEA